MFSVFNFKALFIQLSLLIMFGILVTHILKTQDTKTLIGFFKGQRKYQ